MNPPTEKQVIPIIADVLSELLGLSPKQIELRSSGRDKGFDFEIRTDGAQFLAEYKRAHSAGLLRAGIESLARATKRGTHPLLIVPHMGPLGRRLCEQARVSWVDLSGNAKIEIPGQRIWIEGRPNRYRSPGRPPNVFAPKSSRVARQLLAAPQEFQSQSEIARRTALGDGYVSKIVRRLEAESYLDVNDAGKIRPRDPDILLDAWRDAYDFEAHRILKGHVDARSGPELLNRVAKVLAGQQERWAATGLGAAWLYSGYAMFRMVSVFLSVDPARSLLDELGFSEEPKGANLWLVVPNDDAVFVDSTQADGVQVVSPMQTYLDLKQHPERAEDAANHLRETRINWSSHAV